jgi:hypothetical protein
MCYVNFFIKERDMPPLLGQKSAGSGEMSQLRRNIPIKKEGLKLVQEIKFNIYIDIGFGCNPFKLCIRSSG